jgi:lysozyme
MSKIPEETAKILYELLDEFEGCKLTAYKCPAGVWTLARGFTGKIPAECSDIGDSVVQGMTCTQEQADRLTGVGMQKYWEMALRKSPNLVDASPSRQAAIVDFVYNCGEGNYGISSLLLCVNKGDWKGASQAILKWNKARVKGVLTVLKCLVRRRQAESKLLLVS